MTETSELCPGLPYYAQGDVEGQRIACPAPFWRAWDFIDQAHWTGESLTSSLIVWWWDDDKSCGQKVGCPKNIVDICREVRGKATLGGVGQRVGNEES